MDSSSANTIYNKIKQMEQQIRTTIENISCQDMNYVVIIGITGCGKSSITCCLAHKKVTICQGKGNNAFLEGDGIFSGCRSGTKEPSIVIDFSSKIVICNCPGFEDTEGYNQEIINSFIMDYLIRIISSKRIKILLTIYNAL